MLDILRTKTNTITVYVILGAIIVTFVLGFGPASNKVSCNGTKDVLAKVNGNKLTIMDWKYGLHFASQLYGREGMDSIAFRRITMDKLIERYILQDLANANGIHFTRTDAEDLILKNKVILLGREYPLSYLGGFPSNSKSGAPGQFNYKLFKRFVRSIGGYSDENQFLDQQVIEMEANAYRESFIFGSSSSSKAKWIDYQNSNIGITYKRATFIPSNFTKNIKISDAEISNFLKSSKAKAETEFNSNSKLYTKGPKLRKAIAIKLLIKNEGDLATLNEDIQKQPKKDLDSLLIALPQYKKVFTWLTNQKKSITLDNIAKAAKDMGTKGELIKLDWFGMTDKKVPSYLKVPVFISKIGKTANGPIFTNDGAIFYIVEKEKDSVLNKDQGIRNAAKHLIKMQKATVECKKAADKALADLKAGKPTEEIKGLPEMITEGPVNPVSEDNRNLPRKIARELWNLGNGKVLPRVIPSGKGNMVKYQIYIMQNKTLPSREDFLSMTSENKGGDIFNSKAISSFQNNVYKKCVAMVKSGKLEMSDELTRILNYKRPKNVKPEKLATMPSEHYHPCKYLSTSK